MGIEIPSEVTWLFPIVVGQSWPEGDETALRRMADAYRTAAEGVQGVIDQGNGAASTVVASQVGAAAVAFEEYWKKFSDGDESYLPNLKKICEQLAESCDGTALEVEYTKLSIIASLIALAIEIAALIAAAFATFGTASAGIPIAQQATRLIVQFTFRQLLIAILKEVAISVGIDAAIQGIQMLSGERKDWDWGKTGEAAVSGAVSGLVGGLSGGVKFQGGGLAGQVAVGATRGATEGAVSAVGTAVAMGQDISAKDVLLGATSGAVSGSIGGAKDGITVEAPHVNSGGPGGGPPDLGPTPGSGPPDLGPSGSPGGTPGGNPGGSPGGSPGGAPDGVPGSPGGTPPAGSPGGSPGGAPTPGGSAPSPTGGSPDAPTAHRPGVDTTNTSTVAAPPAPPLHAPAPSGTGGTSSDRAPAGNQAPAFTPSAAPGGLPTSGGPAPSSAGGSAPSSVSSRLGTPTAPGFGGSSPSNSPGGSTPGSSSGSTPGGSTPGGSGSTPGGSHTPGGSTPSGSPSPGSTPGATPGGSHSPGSTPGAHAPAAAAPTPGSHTAPGGSPTPGGFAPTPGGAPGSPAAPGGSHATPGGFSPTPGGSSAAPGGNGSVPGGVHATPGGTGSPAASNGTAATPGDSRPAPGGVVPTGRPTPGTDAVAASSVSAPPQAFHAPQQTGPQPTGPQHTGPQYTGPQPGGFTPQPGGSGPQPGGFTPQPGGPAPQHAGPAQSGPASPRPDAPTARTTPTEAPARTPDSRVPESRTPISPDSRTPGSPDPRTTPDSPQQHPTAPQPVLTPNPDGSSPASSHQWPQDPAPASRGTDPTPNAGPTADPAVDPHQNVWGNPTGVVENFSQDGPYVPIHESTGAGDREVGTYDQRVASIVEPTYQPYGSHGTFDEFMRHNTTDGTVNGPVAWPPNQGAAGARVVVELPAGTVLDRFGSPQGDFLSPLRPDGQPYGFGERAILPDSLGKGYHVYVLDRPMLVELATVAPAFDQPGGARQLQPVFDPSLADASGRVNLDSLREAGVLHEVSTPPANGVVLPPDFGTVGSDGSTVLTPDTATVADAQNGAFDGPTDTTPTPAPTGPTPLGDVSPRVEQAIRSSEVTPAGVALHSEAPLRDLSSRIPANGEHAVLDVHTDGDGVRIGDTHYTRVELVELINNHPDLAGRPIVFVGCDAAAGGENSIAAHVARETGHQVIAPDSLAWSDRHGNVYSSSPETTNGQQSPQIPPDGGWHAFEPDGTSTPVGENGMPPGHLPTGDLADGIDAEHRGERDLQPQVQTPWTEPATTHEQTVRLNDGQSLFDGRELPHDTRIEVLDENGQLRTVVHVDAEGAVSVDAIAPNTRDGVNPEIAHPHPNADYRVQVGNHNDVFVAGDDGTPRTRNDTVKIGGQSVEVTRPVTITEPPTPANGEQTIGRGHPLAPGPNDAFTARADLPPNTRFDVTDTEGDHRGTVQTDEHGTPKWVAAPENAGDRPNPEVANPIPGSNYNVDRGPLFQEFGTDATGRPEPGVTYERPQTGNQVEVTDLPQNRPLTQHDGQPLTSGTEYVVKDGDKVRTRVFVEDGAPTHVETESGQRGRLNPEMARAPEGADITTDPYYGTGAAKTPTWPDPPNGEVRLTQEVVLGENGKPLRDEDNQVVRAVRIDGDTSGWTPEQRAAVERPVRPNDPFVTRDLPPGTRFTLTDERGPYSMFQSGENGAVAHVHTAPPFSAELNNPRPTAVYDVDSGRWKFLTDDRSNTIASTGVPEYEGGTERRRDATSQTDAGALAGKGADGRNLADGGHHQGKESGGPGELINVSSQQRDQNSGLERPGFVREETWYQMERDRAELESSSGGTIELVDTFAIREPGQDHPHTYQTRWRETLPDGRFKIHVRSYPNDHNAALWPSDF